MSDDQFLPRVMIRKGRASGSIHVNFRPKIAGLDENETIIRRLIDLADDWTAYSIASLEFVPQMSQVGFAFVDHAIDEEILNFLNEFCISKEISTDESSGDELFSFIMHEDDLNQVANKMQTTTNMIRAADAVQRSTLGALIAEFDYFLLRFLEVVSMHSPDKFFDAGATVTLRELSDSNSIDSIIQRRVQNTIAGKLRESHSDVIDWIFKEFQLSEGKNDHRKEQIFQDFLEVCQRRHLIIHNGGIVNSTYLEKCKSAGIKEKDLPKLGDRVEINSSYMKRSTARVYLTGYFMLHMFIQKYFPSNADTSHQNLLVTSHTFLENDLTKMCTRICDFAEFSKKKFDHGLILKFAINRSLACLFDPKGDEEDQTKNAAAILDKYDWSVVNSTFQLALACIRRDFSNLIPLAQSAHASGLSYNDARTFCVFREARRINGFLDCFPRSPLLIGGSGSQHP